MDTVWGAGCEGSSDSLLGAGVICDLLHNLAVTLIPHDLMVLTELKEQTRSQVKDTIYHIHKTMVGTWKESWCPFPGSLPTSRSHFSLG